MQMQAKLPPAASTVRWERLSGPRAPCKLGGRAKQPALVVQASPGDILSQLSAIDTSSTINSLQSAVSELQPQLGQVPAHWGTLGLQATVSDLLGQLQLAGLPQSTVDKLKTILESNPAAVDAIQQVRVSLPPLPSAPSIQGLAPEVQVKELLGQLSSSASQVAAPVNAAVDQALDQVAALSSLDGSTLQLSPHWGSQAAQAAWSQVAGQASSLSSSFTQGLSGAAPGEVLAGLEPGAAGAAVQEAARQLQQVVETLGSMPTPAVGDVDLPVKLSGLLEDLRTLAGASASLATPLGTLTSSLPDYVAYPAVGAALTRVTQNLNDILTAGSWHGVDLVTLALSAAGVMLGVGLSAAAPGANAGMLDEASSAESELGYEYDPAALDAYFERRPILVMKRSARVAAEAAALGICLLGDLLTPDGLARNEHVRAQQLRGILERLGPAYVKVAQALSTRVDLLTPAYFQQIQLLQDRVPPFACSEARACMVKAFGRPIEEVFTSLSDKPVAAASLGQVYRATLVPELGGGEVAVKVQRPGVLAAVALDLHLMRKAAVMMQGQMRSDLAAVIDTWAVRFFHEMDYCREADNADTFKRDMASIQGIMVPTAIRSLSCHNVLTSGWVQGEKLCESTATDVRQLCNTLLSAYLIQLLETGFLHADPHPGNLLRTPDGQIAVLDYGLMTEVTEAQRWALLEYIAHLSTSDWPAVARDLQTLGFIPAEVDPEQAGLVEPLGRVMSQLVGGGGAAKVNIDKVMVDLEELGANFPITIPAFFALILRAFSVIEGIALGVDPDYSIVSECFPYLSRRLLSDDSPRARAVLRDILYGGRQRLDIDRLMKLADGFSSFTTDGLTGQTAQDPNRQLVSATTDATAITRTPRLVGSLTTSPASAQLPTTTQQTPAKPAIDPAVRDALLLVFNRQGSYVQQLLVEEAVAAVDVLSRSAVGALVLSLTGDMASQALGNSNGTSSKSGSWLPGFPGGVPMPLGLTLPLSLPLPLPSLPQELFSRLSPITDLTDEDREALAVVRGISQLLSRAVTASAAAPGSLTTTAPQSGFVAAAAGATPGLAAASRVREVVVELGPLLPQLAPGLALTAQQFNMALLSRAQQRMKALIDGPAPSKVEIKRTPVLSRPAASSAQGGAQASQGRAGPPASAGQSKQAAQPAARPSQAAGPVKQPADQWSAGNLLGSGARIRATAASQRMGKQQL